MTRVPSSPWFAASLAVGPQFCFQSWGVGGLGRSLQSKHVCPCASVQRGQAGEGEPGTTLPFPPESTSAVFLSRPRVRLTSATSVFLDRGRPKAGKERGRLGQPDLKGPLRGAFLQSGAFVQWLSPTLCDPMDCSKPSVPVHTRTHAHAQTHPHPHHRKFGEKVTGDWRKGRLQFSPPSI